MKLLIGSSNKGKFIDMKAALTELPVELFQPSDFGIVDSPHEEGSTFPDNALQKARFYHDLTGIPTLADDSGIIVEALKDELGIHTRRWGAGADATDTEWLAYFLDRMKVESNKNARFECCLCFIDELGEAHYFEGTCNGIITDTQESEYLPGLPIASCFKPDGADMVYAAMGLEGKNEWSHRGRAMKKFIEFLNSPHL